MDCKLGLTVRREPWPGSAWRGVLLEVLSRLFNYEDPGGTPAVAV